MLRCIMYLQKRAPMIYLWDMKKWNVWGWTQWWSVFSEHWLFQEIESNFFLNSTRSGRNEWMDRDDDLNSCFFLLGVKFCLLIWYSFHSKMAKKEFVRTVNCGQPTFQILLGPLSSIYSPLAGYQSHSFKLTTFIEYTNTGRVTEKESILPAQHPRQQQSQIERRTDVRKIPYRTILLTPPVR